MDMGLLKSNEQSIATSRANEFYTYTNYVYEVDMIVLNLSYTFNKVKNAPAKDFSPSSCKKAERTAISEHSAFIFD